MCAICPIFFPLPLLTFSYLVMAFFVGSEGTRFPGQQTTDIHLTNWRENNALAPMRQRGTAVAQGLTVVTAESSAMQPQQLLHDLQMGHEGQGSWTNSVPLLANIDFTLLGVSQPNHANHNVVSFVLSIAFSTRVNHQLNPNHLNSNKARSKFKYTTPIIYGSWGMASPGIVRLRS
jgi:hypothetical protein